MTTENKIDISTILILNQSGRIISTSNDRKKSSSQTLAIPPAWLFNHLPTHQHASHIHCAQGSENGIFNYHLYFLETIKYLNFRLNIINISKGNPTQTKETEQRKDLILNQLNLKFTNKLNELFTKRISLASKHLNFSSGEYAYFLNEVEELLSGKKVLDELEEAIKLERSYLDQEEIARRLDEKNSSSEEELEKEKKQTFRVRKLLISPPSTYISP